MDFMTLHLRLEPPYTGVSTPPSPEIPKKSQKGVPGPPRPGVSKECRKSPKWPENESKRLQSQCSGTFWTLFLTLRAGRPGNTFLRPFGDFGARGCGDSCNGDCNRNASFGGTQPRGPCDWKNSIPIDRNEIFNPYDWHFQSRIENFNLDWNFQSRLKISIPTFIVPHKGSLIFNLDWNVQSRLKFSIWDWSLESFNPGAKSWFFSIFGPSGKRVQKQTGTKTIPHAKQPPKESQAPMSLMQMNSYQASGGIALAKCQTVVPRDELAKSNDKT